MASETTAKKKIAGLLSGAPKGGDLPRGLLSKGSMSSYTPTMREKIAGLLAKNWYGDTREGYRQAEKLVNVGETVVPPLGLLSGSYDAGRALGGGDMMQAGVLGGLAMLPLPGALKKSKIPPMSRPYPMASKDNWYGDANYELTGGSITEMSPDEFLAKARPMKIDEVARDNIDDLKRHIEQGGELDPLAIYKNGKEDGRHRAIAAKELGITKLPVLVWDK